MILLKQSVVKLALPSFIGMVFILFFSFNAINAQSTDELKISLQEAKTDTARLRILFDLAYAFQIVDNTKAFEYSQMLYDLAVKKSDTASMVKGLNMLGYFYYNTGILDMALQHNLEALALAEAIKHETLVDNVRNHIGVIYDDRGDHRKSIQYYLLNLKYADKYNFNDDQVIALINIGDAYYRLELYDSAMLFLNQSLSLFDFTDDGYRSIILNNLALVYEVTDRIDEAKEMVIKSLKLQENADEDYTLTAETYLTWAKIEIKKGNRKKASTLIEKSLEFSLKAESPFYQRQAYELQADNFSKMGEYQKAFESSKNYIEANEKIYNEKSVQKFLELQEFYAVQQKEAKIALLEKSNQLASQKILRKNITLISLLVGAAMLILMIMSLRSRNKIKDRTNRLLSFQKAEIIKRNEELSELTEELNAQKEEIETSHDQLRRINEKLEIRNKDVTDSINYAKKIQNSLLPSLDRINNAFPDYFILYKPRDIVSGDFYWFYELKDDAGKVIKHFIASIDCTGHGVPGAFMSTIADALLSQIIVDFSIYEPNQILEEMDKRIRILLKQEENDSRDGMEISMCVIDYLNSEMTYAGAGAKILYIADDELNRIKGDRHAIGELWMRDKEVKYTKHQLPLTNKFRLYLFSDGFQDQFGGPSDKKYSFNRLKNLIIQNQSLSLKQQLRVFETSLQQWMQNSDQVDDIMLMGFEISTKAN